MREVEREKGGGRCKREMPAKLQLTCLLLNV